MPIPVSNDIRQPLLEYLMNERIPVKLSTIIEEMGKRMNLTKRELEETVPSGGRRFAARVNMLVVKLKKDGLVKASRHSYLEITQAGIDEAQKILVMSRQKFRPEEVKIRHDESMVAPQPDNNYNDGRAFQELLKAYVSKNEVKIEDLPKLGQTLRELLSGQKQQPFTPASVTQEQTTAQTPAIPIDESITEDYIVCLECGKKFISLKRHLGSHHQLTPEEYRAKWGLPADYPMIAKKVSEKRSQTAKNIGLGQIGQAARKEQRTE